MASYFIVRNERGAITSLGFGDRGEPCTYAQYVEALGTIGLARATESEIEAMARGEVKVPPALVAVQEAARKELGGGVGQIELPVQPTKPETRT